MSTSRYTNSVVFNENDYETAAATAPEQVEQLGSEGWTEYDEDERHTLLSKTESMSPLASCTVHAFVTIDGFWRSHSHNPPFSLGTVGAREKWD